MSKHLKSFKLLIYYKFILLLSLVLQFSKSKKQINIKLKGEKIEDTIKNLTEVLYFTAEVEQGYTPKNLKIIIQGLEYDRINHIVSFYQQDSTFSSRKQLFQSFTTKTQMWLNKKQIKDKFYFTVDCNQFPCDFNYTILDVDKFELNYGETGETFTYYITEETKEMKFNIKIDSNSQRSSGRRPNNIISIWANGINKINCKLDAPNYIKHSKYNSFLIQTQNITHISNFNFTISGEIVDLIKVGTLFIKEFSTFYSIKNNEISIFLKKNVIESFCFQRNSNSNVNNLIISTSDYNGFYNLSNVDNGQNGICLSLKEGFEEAFFSYKFHLKNDKNDKQNINTSKVIEFFPHFLGIKYTNIILGNNSIGIEPIRPANDFSYLTYHIQIMSGEKVKPSIYTCNTYPKCILDSEKLKNPIPIVNINSNTFAISFSKNELNKFSSSIIDKKQKILIVTCEKKLDNSIWGYMPSCIININIYSNKNKIYINDELTNYRYIAKYNDNFNFFYSYFDSSIFPSLCFML